MRRKLQNTAGKICSLSAVIAILVIWQAVCAFGLVDSFALPSPMQVLTAFVQEFPALMEHSVVGAVISEWLGGFNGLGVYMTRVKKAYSFDKMFAVIFLISIISLLLMKGVDLLQRKSMPWEKEK